MIADMKIGGMILRGFAQNRTLVRIGKVITSATGVDNRSVWLAIVAMFVAAICIYGVAALHVGLSPSVADSFYYNTVAQRMAYSNIYAWSDSIDISEGNSNAYILPGYMIFLSLFYRAVPLTTDIHYNFAMVQCAIVITQLILVSLAASAIFLAAYFLGGRRVAAVTAVFTLSYMAIGANATVLMTESITYFYISFIMLAMVALLRRRGSPWFWMTVFGLFSGLYLITRAAIVIYIAAFLAFWVIYNYKNWQKAIVQSFVAGMCIMLFMGPWIVRNYHLYNEVIIFNTGAEHPLFISTLYDGMGGRYPSDEELELFRSEVGIANRQPLGAIARYRLANAREEWGLRHFIYVRYVSKIQSYPRSPTLLMKSDGIIEARYPKVLGNADFSRPFAEGEGRDFWWYSMNVHRLVVFVAIAGTAVALFRTRGSERVAFFILALFPIYMLAVHLQILYLPRYMYQSLPATFLLAGGVALLLPQKPLQLPFTKNKSDKDIVAEDNKFLRQERKGREVSV